MENFGLSLWKDYGLNNGLSWHISYAMKLWHKYSKQDFVGVLVGKCKSCGLDYVRVGKNCVTSGDQGGAFMAPWERWEMSLKPCLGQFSDSFGSTAIGGLQGLGSWGLMLRREIESSCMGEVCSQFCFSTWFLLFLQYED